MNNKAKYTFLSYLFIAITIFIVIVISKDLIIQTFSSSEQLKQIKNSIEWKNQEYAQFLTLKNSLDKWESEIPNFSKFLIHFSEDEILEYFYNYANNHISTMAIKNLWLTSWSINEFWFHEANINIQADFQKEQDMIDFLNFVLKSEKYNFYIHDFSYPYGALTQGPLSINIPIKILYK